MVKILLSNIYSDFRNYIGKKLSIKELREKYLFFNKKVNENLVNEIKKKLYIYNYINKEYTLFYFNALCLWNLFYYINNNNGPNECIINYIELYNKISNKQELSFVDKSMILISFDERIFESNKTFNIPKLYFYNELDDWNPYKIAYNFQYEIIEKLSEQSWLFYLFLY